MTTSVRLKRHNDKTIRELGINLSAYVNKKLEEDYLDENFLNSKIIELKEEISKYESLIGEIREERTNFNQAEIDYIKESSDILNRKNEDSIQFKNRYKGFIQQFNKKFITFEIFTDLVRNYNG